MALAGCRDGPPGAALAAENSPLRTRLGRIACVLGCQEHEDTLAEAFAPWWDHQLPQTALREACRMVGDRYSEAFLGAVVQGRVFWRCCSETRTECSPSPPNATSLTDRDLLLLLVAEVARATDLPDMLFLFNTGDQPFPDKTYWAPIPQFHWVRSAGHWGVPLPNPFQLRAHVFNLLGDSETHRKRLVPWPQKIAKVFWRGALAAPDDFMTEDVDSLPRVRLMNIARTRPELFDVAVTTVDKEIYKTMNRSQVEVLMARISEGRHVDSRKAMPKHRYVINVSAVLSAWRLSEMLASGSVLLLQEDVSRELIYDWLTPWEHFVPIANGLSDLVDKVEWLEDHQDVAQAIAARGLERFETRVRRQDTYCYLMQALTAMADVTKLDRLSLDDLLQHAFHEADPAVVAALLPTHEPLEAMLSSLRSSRSVAEL